MKHNHNEDRESKTKPLLGFDGLQCWKTCTRILLLHRTHSKLHNQNRLFINKVISQKQNSESHREEYAC